MEVNGKIVTDLGMRISPKRDRVFWKGKEVKLQESMVYLLMNKPPQVLTATSDPKGRTTVMDLLHETDRAGLFPVGRLDKDTTGVLLITNDGELGQRLTHPRYKVPKIYHVTLHRGLWSEDENRIREGIELEDGVVKVDSIQPLDKGKHPKRWEVSIHLGKKRIIRRLFEALGYDVVDLNRISFAGLTAKGLEQGDWRELTSKEISSLRKLAGLED